MPVEKKVAIVSLVIIDFIHELVQFLLSAHNRRVLNFFIVLDKFWSRVVENLGSEGNVFLKLVERLSMLSVSRKHFEFVALAVRHSEIRLALIFALIFKIETAADQKHYFFVL